jgi:hypothetical protein
MKRLAALIAVGLSFSAGNAKAAAWTSAEGDLVFTQTSLADFYSFYARNSTNSKLLQEPQGSIVQAGPVRRFGFLLTGEYGLTERVTAQLSLAYFYTQHLSVGDNVEFFTNSERNTQLGLQDFTGSVKYLAYQTQGPVLFGLSPSIGWVLPLRKYDTSVNNPIGDGLNVLDLGLSASMVIPSARLFINGDIIYKARENKAARVGNIWPKESVAAIPEENRQFISGIGAEIHDQVQGLLEVGYFFTHSLSLRGIVRRIETLGGENLTFQHMPDMMQLGIDKQAMFENSLAYDQDALYLGIGPYWQVNDWFGVGATYTHAVWFKNFPNMKTLVLSLSFNPQFAKRRQDRELAEQLALEQAEADAEQGEDTVASGDQN